MKNNLKYSILLICTAIILVLLVRYLKAQSKDYKTKKEIQELTKTKDSLFTLADRVVDSVEVDKKTKEIQIDSLKTKLANQKEIVKTKTVYIESAKNDEKTIVSAVSFDISGMEKELERRQQIIEHLSRMNLRLNQELDSIKGLIDTK